MRERAPANGVLTMSVAMAEEAESRTRTNNDLMKIIKQYILHVEVRHLTEKSVF